MQLIDNYSEIKAKARKAGEKYGIRESFAPEIIIVTKTHGPEAISPLLEYGHRIFGENRVQEAQKKWPALKEKFSNIELHLIGPLQTNKVKEALEIFDVIQTLDRQKLAEAIAKEFAKSKNIATKSFFVQVNTGEEAQKSGILPQEADNFIKYCKETLKLPVIGLMCIPPISGPPSLHFALLRKIAERNNLKYLSMGMSSDFEIAVTMGATHIRIGSAIFGERKYGAKKPHNKQDNN